MPIPIARWLGRLREPYDRFHGVARELGNGFQVWVARKDGQAVAAAVLLIHGKNASYWRSASIKEMAGPTRANDLLQLRMIEAACQAGCRHYHMGESGEVESLKHFKSRFGAVEQAFPTCFRELIPVTSTRKRLSELTRRLNHSPVKDA